LRNSLAAKTRVGKSRWPAAAGTLTGPGNVHGRRNSHCPQLGLDFLLID
jgi:hypothetical protein